MPRSGPSLLCHLAAREHDTGLDQWVQDLGRSRLIGQR